MDAIKKLVVLIETPLNERDYKRFGIEVLQENGYDVHVWNLTPFICPEDCNTTLNNPVTPDIYVSFECFADFEKAVSGLCSSCFIICMVAYQLRSFHMYKLLSRHKLSYCVFSNNALPSAEHKKPSLFYRIRNSTIRQKVDYAFLHIPFKYLSIKPARLVLAGGTVSLNNTTYPIDETTEVLWLHALDYDLYLDELNSPDESASELGVFLDSYLPFHPDFIRMGSPSPATSEEYYPLFRRLFDYIEDVLEVHVLIAAHPRSRYEDHSDYFGGRPAIRGKTVELIRRSKFVITHNSTAINLAVLFRKPIVFVTTDQLNQGWMGLDIESMAARFGKRPINLNEPLSVNWDEEFLVNEDAYSKYESDYIKRPNTTKSHFWQAFADHIKGYGVTRN